MLLIVRNGMQDHLLVQPAHITVATIQKGTALSSVINV